MDRWRNPRRRFTPTKRRTGARKGNPRTASDAERKETQRGKGDKESQELDSRKVQQETEPNTERERTVWGNIGLTEYNQKRQDGGEDMSTSPRKRNQNEDFACVEKGHIIALPRKAHG